MTTPPPHAVGIDLGGTNAQVGLVDASGRITHRKHMAIASQAPWQATADALAQAIRSLCDDAGAQVASAIIGVGAAGSIDAAAGTIVEAPNLRWNDVPLARELASRLDGRPVVLDNDVNAAALAEARYGAARDQPDLLAVWVGTGIGGGVMLDGTLVRGPLGSAGEIGRTLLVATGPLGQQRLEDICSRSALTRRLHELVRTNHDTSLRDALLEADDARAFPARELASAYDEGDILVRALVDEAADLLGRGIASACTLLGVPFVVLGGGLTEALGQPYVDAIATSCNAHVLPRLKGRVRCVMTGLGPDAGIVGAAIMARDAAERGVL